MKTGDLVSIEGADRVSVALDGDRILLPTGRIVSRALRRYSNDDLVELSAGERDRILSHTRKCMAIGVVDGHIDECSVLDMWIDFISEVAARLESGVTRASEIERIERMLP